MHNEALLAKIEHYEWAHKIRYAGESVPSAPSSMPWSDAETTPARNLTEHAKRPPCDASRSALSAESLVPPASDSAESVRLDSRGAP